MMIINEFLTLIVSFLSNYLINDVISKEQDQPEIVNVLHDVSLDQRLVWI